MKSSPNETENATENAKENEPEAASEAAPVNAAKAASGDAPEAATGTAPKAATGAAPKAATGTASAKSRNVGKLDLADDDDAANQGFFANPANRVRAFAGAVLVVIIVLAFMWFLNANEQRIVNQNAEYLEGSTQQSSRRIDDSFNNALASIRIAADVYGESMDSDQVDPGELGSLGSAAPFDYIVYADSSGRVFDPTGKTADASEREYVTKGLHGDTGMCPVFDAAFSEGNAIAFYTPLKRDGRIVGVLAGIYTESTLTDIMTTYFFGEQTTTYLCDSSGDILARSSVFANPVESVFDLFAEGDNEITRNDLERAFGTGTSISFSYQVEDGTGTGSAYLMKLPSSDWMILRTFPSSITNSMVSHADQAGVALVTAIAAAFIIFIVIVTVQAKRQNQRLRTEKHRSDQIVNGALKLFQRFAEIDLRTDTYEYLKNSEEKLNLPLVGPMSQYREYWLEQAYSKEDVDVVAAAYNKANIQRDLRPDVPYLQFEYRVANATTGEQEWRQISLIALERDENGVPVLVLCAAQNVTEVKQREQMVQEALREAAAAADQASKAKSDFLNSMSHDIRTPMNSIMGLTAIAAMHIDDTDRVRDSLSKITMASRHLLSLINEVLDMAKIESGDITLNEEPFNLSETVEGLLTIVSPQLDAKGQELLVDISQIKHEHVVGDPMRLQQVFVNIMSNSIKFTPEGGTVALHMRELPSKVPDYALYQFVFEDTGCGMSPEFLKRVFEPFTRANDSRVTKIEGTGLGMSIVKSVVSRMNGTIDVESELGVGTTFTVTVSLKLQEHEDEDLAELAGLHVLVADDEEITCQNAVMLLESIGMKGDYVLNGEDACKKVAAAAGTPEAYSVVILDYRMPGKSGVEAAREIREIVPEGLPIIVLSAYDWSAIEQDARGVEIDAFIAKPMFRSRLISVMKELLYEQGESQVSDEELLSSLDYADKRILLTEDNAIAAGIAQDILQMTGAKVDHAENGQIAVDLITDAAPGTYDLVLMDIQMPVMNGYEAARSIREAAKNGRPDLEEVPIVALTADAFVEAVQRAHAAGMNAHMAKPLEIPTLVATLRTWFGD